MSEQESNRRKVDPEFRKILLDLTVEYLAENPPDFLDFALEFFKRKRKERTSLIKPYKFAHEDSEDENDDDCWVRRASVRAESFDPLEDADIVPVLYPKTDSQREKLKCVLDGIVFFVAVQEEDRELLVDAMQEKTVSKHDVVITEGDVGDFFYIVEHGRFEAFKTNDGKVEVLKTYDNEGFFGELALLYNAPRASTVRALSNGVLWALDRMTFRSIVVKAEYNRTLMYEELLGTVPLLECLTPEERRTVADCLTPCVYRAGQRLICEGEAADGMFFIVSGTARVTVRDKVSSRELELKTLTTGDYFGELALITHKPRAASVYAADRVQVAFLEINSFERLLGPCMDVLHRNIGKYEEEMKTWSEHALNN